MNVAGKRLLVLGAGRGQLGLYRAAKEMGITTIAGTMPSFHQACIDLADEICYMDISNPAEVADKAAKLALDGVATCCLDTGIVSLGRVCDTLGVTGLTENAAIMCGDKYKMKEAFIREGVNTAKFFQVDNEEVLAAALESLKLPVIVKATDLQGSKGIYIAHTQEEAYAGFRAAMELTKKDYCIVEEYIVGWEFGAQAFVYKNEVFFVMPHGDETYMSHTAVPIGHYVPLQEEPLVIAKIEDEVKKAIRAIGLNNCAVNVDMILRDGKVYMIELTGRAGANCLPELVEINFGVAYYKMIAAMALSENPAELWAGRNKVQQAGLARMMMSKDKAGIIENIYYDGKWTEDILEITFFKGVGDTVNRFETSNDCIGQVIVKGNSLEDCQARVSEIMSEVKIEGLK